MARFLHFADIHLGYNRYQCAERTKDFFHAFDDSIERYALEPRVDFVLIAGDLFEHRSIQPSILNQAQLVLERLRAENIPVLAIEGNHDNRPYGVKTSWLRYLAEQEQLILLEPSEDEAGELVLPPWDPDCRRGGYIDLDCGVRVVGSQWAGASTPQLVKKLAQALTQLPPMQGQTVMMLHHGLEGQVARYEGALRYRDLLPLQEAGVDYLALGHIHKNYEEAGWIFNPGSLEANSVAESRDQMVRGVYRVTIGPEGIEAQLERDYAQRSIWRLVLAVTKTWSPEDLWDRATALVQAKGEATQGAIVELRIQGQVGFNRLDINGRALQRHLQEISGALVFLLKYEVTGTEYESFVAPEAHLSRPDLETLVFQDLLARYDRYSDSLDPLARALREVKTQVLEGSPPEDLYQQVETLLMGQEAGVGL